MPLKITWTAVREEDIRILQQANELVAIFLGTVQNRRTHANLRVPDEGLHVRVIGPPDIENIRAVPRQVSADACSRYHMSHAKSTNAIQGPFSVSSERYWLAFSD